MVIHTRTPKNKHDVQNRCGQINATEIDKANVTDNNTQKQSHKQVNKSTPKQRSWQTEKRKQQINTK